MMQKIKLTIISCGMLLGLVVAPVVVIAHSSPTNAATAADPQAQICKGINNGGTCDTTGNNDLGGWIKGIINIILYIIGAIAVLMIVIGGMRYVLSGGEASQTKSAKDTILYAVIGLVIAVLAYAIVNFVVFNLKTPTP